MSFVKIEVVSSSESFFNMEVSKLKLAAYLLRILEKWHIHQINPGDDFWSSSKYEL